MSALQVDTSDLRAGAPLHDDLLALLPLIGVWAGSGHGMMPATGARFEYVEQVTFAHDGRPFVVYESRSWLTDSDGAIIRAAARETGFWRPGAGPDDVEVVLALSTGLTLNLVGMAGDQRWELASTQSASGPAAKQVDGNRRLYAIVDGALVYAQELARAAEAYEPHLNARLERIRAS